LEECFPEADSGKCFPGPAARGDHDVYLGYRYEYDIERISIHKGVQFFPAECTKMPVDASRITLCSTHGPVSECHKFMLASGVPITLLDNREETPVQPRMEEKRSFFDQYLLETFGVRDLAEISFYPKGGVPIWAPARTTTITVPLVGKGVLTIPPGDYRSKAAPQEQLDLSCVSVRSMVIRQMQTKGKIQVKRIYYPRFAAARCLEQDRLAEEMGVQTRVIIETPPNGANYALNQTVIEEIPGSSRLHLNEATIKTFMFMTEEILMRGVHKLSPETCARASLPKQGTLFDPERECSYVIDVDYYMLVPADHVLGWKLQCLDYYRRSQGLYALDYGIQPKNGDSPYRLCFLVANATFDRLVKETLETYVGNIDKRPLSEVGLESVGEHDVVLNVSLTFVAYPRLGDAKPPLLLPTLAPNYPPYAEILQRELDKAQWEKQDEEERKKK
jgi:hypothetical protein